MKFLSFLIILALIFGAWSVISPSSLSRLLAPFGIEGSVFTTRSAIHTATQPTLAQSDAPLTQVSASGMLASGVVTDVEGILSNITTTWSSFFGLAQDKIEQGKELKNQAEEVHTSVQKLQNSYDRFTSFSGSQP